MRSRPIANGAIALVTVLTVSACGGAAEEAPEQEFASPSVGAESIPIEATPDTGLEFLDHFGAVAEGFREYGSQSLTGDRTGAVVYWYGDLPSSVREVVATFERRGLKITIRRTRYLPAALREEAAALVQAFPAEVAGASPTNEFDGILVTLNGAGGSAAEAKQELVRLNIDSLYPLSAAFTSPGPR